MKEYSTFPKTLGFTLTLRCTLISLFRTLVGGGGSYPSAKMQSAHSTPPADRVAFWWSVYIFIMTFHSV